ncbi:MAG TPA: hypothetical protein VFK57_07640 [Vicinamibacterales bacterium]|nr:hypothetical protein [Vicinamibacterales bacterium]
MAPVTPNIVPDLVEDAGVGLKTQLDDVEFWERVWRMRPASVTIARTHASDVGLRQLVITLDGERLGDLLFGESIQRDVAPGPHRLRVSNTLVWKTLEFDVKPGEQVRFEAINRPGKLTYPLLVLFGAAPLYLTVRRVG